MRLRGVPELQRGLPCDLVRVLGGPHVRAQRGSNNLGLLLPILNCGTWRRGSTRSALVPACAPKSKSPPARGGQRGGATWAVSRPSRGNAVNTPSAVSPSQGSERGVRNTLL